MKHTPGPWYTVESEFDKAFFDRSYRAFRAMRDAVVTGEIPETSQLREPKNG